jgi:hypothetical protein
VLQNGLRQNSSRTSISRTTMRPRNIILKVVSSKTILIIHFTDSRYWNDDFCPEARVNVSNIFVLC